MYCSTNHSESSCPRGMDRKTKLSENGISITVTGEQAWAAGVSIQLQWKKSSTENSPMRTLESHVLNQAD